MRGMFEKYHKLPDAPTRGDASTRRQDEKHKFYLDEICPSNDRKAFQDIPKAVQATKII